MQNDLQSRAEAFLFVEGGTMSLRKLGELLGLDREALRATLDELPQKLKDRGITLVQTDQSATLALSEVTSRAVEEAYKAELEREIGDAGLEVLAIVLYRGPSTRTQIDYVRGVNTSSTIRTLLRRGLLERTGNPEDAREYLYRPTPELLAHVGAESAEALPDYASIKNELAAFEQKRESAEENHAGDTE